jgi:pimeloyl-ACP methyl ester carboxylesterase
MAILKRPDGEIVYQVLGEGYPVLALAPGWLNSAIRMWPHPTDRFYPWTNWPELLRDGYSVVIMDQRNAGASNTAIEADHGWHTFADDHLALIEHLGLARFHMVGVCIGASFALRLAEMIPGKISAMVLPQPIGLDPAAPTNFPDRFVAWSEDILAKRPDLDADAVKSFGANMWDGDFIYSVSRESVAACAIPSLVMPGSNVAHPPAIGAEVHGLLQNSELLAEWEAPDFEAQQRRRGREFLDHYRP